MTSLNSKNKPTYNVSDVIVGDIVKFKGTRNRGHRRILEIHELELYKIDAGWYDSFDYFCRVLNVKMSGFSEQQYTSTNNVDKLSHVFRDGNWYKVIKD